MKRLTILAAAFASLALGAAGAATAAFSNVQSHYIYYDEGWANVVGEVYIYCDSTVYQWGEFTSREEQFHYNC